VKTFAKHEINFDGDVWAEYYLINDITMSDQARTEKPKHPEYFTQIY